MAEETNKLQDRPPTFRAALMNMNPKIALAFFLTTIAALMVIILLAILVNAPAGKLDAGTIALIASMIMLFIKMAADANGYQTNSSAGSDKKDETSATVQKALADKVPGAVPVPTVVVSWWSLMEPDEKAAIEASADSKIKAIHQALISGTAEPPDIAVLIAAGLLKPERAVNFKTA